MNPARTRHPRLGEPPAHDGSPDAPGDGRTRIAPQSGVAVELAPGDRLTVLDPCGEQVSDLYLVASGDVPRVFSSGRTTDYGISHLRVDRLAAVVEPQPGHGRGRRRHRRRARPHAHPVQPGDLRPALPRARRRPAPVVLRQPRATRSHRSASTPTASARPSTSSWTCGPTSAASCTSTRRRPARVTGSPSRRGCRWSSG